MDKPGSTAHIEMTNNGKGKNNENDDSCSGSSLYLKDKQDMHVIFDNVTKDGENKEANVTPGDEFAD